MSLADRLDQARRSQPEAPNGHDAKDGSKPAVVRVRDPFAAVKASVHQALLDSLGPQLQLGLLQVRVVQLRTQGVQQRLVDAGLHRRERVTDPYHRRLRPILGVVPIGRLRLRTSGLVQAVGETHHFTPLRNMRISRRGCCDERPIFANDSSESWAPERFGAEGLSRYWSAKARSASDTGCPGLR